MEIAMEKYNNKYIKIYIKNIKLYFQNKFQWFCTKNKCYHSKLTITTKSTCCVFVCYCYILYKQLLNFRWLSNIIYAMMYINNYKHNIDESTSYFQFHSVTKCDVQATIVLKVSNKKTTLQLRRTNVCIKNPCMCQYLMVLLEKNSKNKTIILLYNHFIVSSYGGYTQM